MCFTTQKCPHYKAISCRPNYTDGWNPTQHFECSTRACLELSNTMAMCLLLRTHNIILQFLDTYISIFLSAKGNRPWTFLILSVAISSGLSSTVISIRTFPLLLTMSQCYKAYYFHAVVLKIVLNVDNIFTRIILNSCITFISSIQIDLKQKILISYELPSTPSSSLFREGIPLKWIRLKNITTRITIL